MLSDLYFEALGSHGESVVDDDDDDDDDDGWLNYLFFEQAA